jgi:hypothetical protein
MQTNLTARALRLVRKDKIEPVTDARVYRVDDEGDLRTVVVSDSFGSRCDCPDHSGVCPHQLAVLVYEDHARVTATPGLTQVWPPTGAAS